MKKVCDLADHPELSAMVDKMELLKENLISEAEYHHNAIDAIKKKAITQAKLSWDEVVKYLKEKSLIAADYNTATDSGTEGLSIDKDNNQIVMMNKIDQMLFALKTMAEAKDKAERDSQKNSDGEGENKAKNPNKEFLN